MNRGLMVMTSILLFLMNGPDALAQATTLDPVTTTASLSEKRTSETGRNITIIQGNEILNLPVHSLDELLKYVPGIDVQSRGPQGSQSDISMRGGTYQQVLVILDGLRVNDPNSGHFSAYIPITPAQIDRIEVLKGASAAVYGSDAVGGVISIITKSFNSNPPLQKTVVKGQLGLGAHDLVNANAGAVIQSGRWRLDAGLLSNHSTGVPQRGINGFFHNTSASAGVHYSINDFWSLSARTAYDHRDFAAQNFYTTFSSDTATEQVKSWWNQLRIHFKKGRSKLSLDAGYKHLYDEYAYNSLAPANQNRSGLFQSLLLLEQRLQDHLVLIAGFNYQNKQIASNDRGDHALHTAAPFVSLSQTLGDRFTILPSLRVEFIGRNRPELLPQLTGSFHSRGLQLRASGGRTIRDAEFTERYNNYNKEQVSGGSIGNPALVPEVSWNYEFGGDWFAPSGLRISSTFFQRFHTRLIDWVSTPYAEMPRKDNLDPAGSYALATNIAKVNTSGFETDVQFNAPLNEQQRLVLNGGVIWLYSSSSQANPSFYISSHARFLSNFNLRYEIGPASISLTGIYKTRAPRQATGIDAAVSRDYFVCNGRATYGFLQKKLSVFIQADNILDRTYSDLLGTQMPGRWLQGGVSWQWAE